MVIAKHKWSDMMYILEDLYGCFVETGRKGSKITWEELTLIKPGSFWIRMALIEMFKMHQFQICFEHREGFNLRGEYISETKTAIRFLV